MDKFGLKTKKAITELLKDCLHNNEAGTVPNENVSGVLRELVNHYRPELMKDDVFKHFEIQENNTKHNAFFVRTHNGGLEAFGYRWAIRSYTPLSRRRRYPDHIYKMLQAARNEIQYQIKEFRDSKAQFGVIDEMKHVDHVVPFIKLVSDWYASMPEVKIDLYVDNRDIRRFKLNQHSQSWQEYHKTHAKLQMLDATENLRKGAGGVRIDWYNLINQKKKRN